MKYRCAPFSCPDEETVKKRKKKQPYRDTNVNRGRASQVPHEVAAQVGALVVWRPHRSPAGVSVLCVCTNVRFRYGRWDFELLPVAGSGVIWAESPFVAPAPVAELQPAQLVADLEERFRNHYEESQDDHQDHEAAQAGY